MSAIIASLIFYSYLCLHNGMTMLVEVNLALTYIVCLTMHLRILLRVDFDRRFKCFVCWNQQLICIFT